MHDCGQHGHGRRLSLPAHSPLVCGGCSLCAGLSPVACGKLYPRVTAVKSGSCLRMAAGCVAAAAAVHTHYSLQRYRKQIRRYVGIY
ncbi:hypothetical protein GW17_00061485 [Ensete ventricosum]|nr:hypothetical protein GW17_00061485 [Ensete ventricosum]